MFITFGGNETENRQKAEFALAEAKKENKKGLKKADLDKLNKKIEDLQLKFTEAKTAEDIKKGKK